MSKEGLEPKFVSIDDVAEIAAGLKDCPFSKKELLDADMWMGKGVKEVILKDGPKSENDPDLIIGGSLVALLCSYETGNFKTINEKGETETYSSEIRINMNPTMDLLSCSIPANTIPDISSNSIEDISLKTVA